MIGRLLHQIWIGDQRPDDFLVACRQSVLELHNDWQHQYWTDASILRHPQLASRHEALQAAWEAFGRGLRPIPYRVDLLKLCVIYVYGGFLIDHDCYGIRPLDQFVGDELVIGRMTDKVVAESIIGAPAGSERIAKVLDDFVKRRPEERPDRKVSMGLHRHCQRQGWPVYAEDYFCPHTRCGGDVYRVTRNTHLIHCFHRDRHYELDRLKALRGLG
jgi:mannosyltransferase OCH1-like enzyme